MSELTDWTRIPCEKHEMTSCGDCLAASKMRRVGAEIRYQADCAVNTYCELTGEDYEAGVAALRAAGYIPGKGTPEHGIRAAFEAVGFTVTREYISYERLAALSAAGTRQFFVAGYKGKAGHAWSVSNGTARRAYAPPFRYAVYEVTA